MEYFELIEKYINRELNEKEINEFKNMLSENKKLKNEFDLVNDVDEFLNNINEIKFRKELEKIIKKQAGKEKEVVKRVILTPLLKIAASIIIVFGLSFYLYNTFSISKGSRIFEKNYQAYEYSNASRSVNDTELHQKFQNALKAYNSQEYKTAGDLFQYVRAKNSEYLIAEMLLGICYIELDETKKAIKVFENITEKDDYLMKETANWYLGLCYLKSEDYNNAMVIFEQFISYDNFYNEKAQKILKKIK